MFEGIATPLGAEELLLLIGLEGIVMFFIEEGDSDVEFCVGMVMFLIMDGEMEVPFCGCGAIGIVLFSAAGFEVPVDIAPGVVVHVDVLFASDEEGAII